MNGSDWIYSPNVKTVYSLPSIDSLKIINYDFNSVSLEWQCTTNLPILNSEIYIKEISKTLEVKEALNKFKITNLLSNTFYTLKVRVLNLSGYSDWSEEMKIKTNKTILWDSLNSFNIKEYFDDSVLLRWDQPQSDTIITKYEIYLSKANNIFRNM